MHSLFSHLVNNVYLRQEVKERKKEHVPIESKSQELKTGKHPKPRSAVDVTNSLFAGRQFHKI